MKFRHLLPALALTACTDGAPRVIETHSPAPSPSATASAWRTAARLELRPVFAGPVPAAECTPTSTAPRRGGTPMRKDDVCYFAGPVALHVDRLTEAVATQQRQEPGRWAIEISLPPDTGRALHAVTTRYLNQPLLLVLDGELRSAPTIEAAVSDAVVITGDFTQEEAERIAARLRTRA